MKKFLHKAVGILLVLAIVAGMGAFVFAEEDKLVYACLGDSNAAGYRTTGYVDSRIPAPNAYHTLVAEALGAELMTGATSGFRSDELRYMLEPGYQLDWTYFTNPLMEPTLRGVRLLGTIQNCKADDNHITTVEAADIITVQVGVNDVLCDALGSVYDELSKEVYAITALKSALNMFGVADEATIAALDKVASAIQMVNFIGKFVMKLPSTVEDFYENWDAIIENIYRINPDAEIVAISVLNPFSNLRITADSEFRVGKLLDGVFKKLNNWIAYNSEYADTYYFCDIRDIELDKSVLTDDSFMGTFIISTHPSDANHKDIAERIVKIIKTGVDSKA